MYREIRTARQSGVLEIAADERTGGCVMLHLRRQTLRGGILVYLSPEEAEALIEAITIALEEIT